MAVRPFRHPTIRSATRESWGAAARPNPARSAAPTRACSSLDEMPEFNRKTLEVLRQPLEEGQVTISLRPQSPAPGLSTLRLARWSGLPAPQDSAQILFKRRQKRLVAQWSAGTLVSTQEFDVLLPNHPGEETAPVWRRARARERPVRAHRPCREGVGRRCSTDSGVGALTSPARTGLSSTYRAAVSRYGSSSTNEANRPCQRWPRQPSRKFTMRVYRR